MCQPTVVMSAEGIADAKLYFPKICEAMRFYGQTPAGRKTEGQLREALMRVNESAAKLRPTMTAIQKDQLGDAVVWASLGCGDRDYYLRPLASLMFGNPEQQAIVAAAVQPHVATIKAAVLIKFAIAHDAGTAGTSVVGVAATVTVLNVCAIGVALLVRRWRRQAQSAMPSEGYADLV